MTGHTDADSIAIINSVFPDFADTVGKYLKPREQLYEASHIKRRRSTKAEVEGRRLQNSDTRSKNFGSISVELDAIEPNLLRALVETVIQEHLPEHQFQILKAAEQSERELLKQLVGNIGRGA